VQTFQLVLRKDLKNNEFHLFLTFERHLNFIGQIDWTEMKYEEILDNTSVQVTEFTPISEKKTTTPKKRILSLDCVRGITICFMIIGNFAQSPKYNWLQHADWNGWTTLDLVFPVNFKN
jgi:hypothetical protein